METRTPLHTIRIGTIVNASERDLAGYIRQILPYGFESFAISFGMGPPEKDISRAADEIMGALDGSGVVISSIGVYGNALETGEEDEGVRRAWEELIDKAHLFGTDI